MQMLETAWLKFVRPPRLLYTVFDLGAQNIKCGQHSMTRIDIEITNKQGSKLQGCFFSVTTSDKAVIYCHGFNGCMVEAVKYAKYAADLGLNFCCFDFQGAGMSEGEYITLGHLEQDDIQTVLHYLRQTFHIKQFVLWGRSMGASTILLHQLKYGQSDVQALILDSPFQQLSKLAVRMARKQVPMPKFIVRTMLALIRRQILSNVGFDIDKISLSDKSIQVGIPAYFITSKTDTIVPAKHTIKVMQAYSGQKQIQYVTGDHNEVRSDDFLRDIMSWANRQFMLVKTPRNESHRVQTLFTNHHQKKSSPDMGAFSLQNVSSDPVISTSVKVANYKKRQIFEQQQIGISPDMRSKSPKWTPINRHKQNAQDVLSKYQNLSHRRSSNTSSHTQQLKQTLEKYTNKYERGSLPLEPSQNINRDDIIRSSVVSNPAKHLKNSMQQELRSSIVMDQEPEVTPRGVFQNMKKLHI